MAATFHLVCPRCGATLTGSTVLSDFWGSVQATDYAIAEVTFMDDAITAHMRAHLTE